MDYISEFPFLLGLWQGLGSGDPWQDIKGRKETEVRLFIPGFLLIGLLLVGCYPLTKGHSTFQGDPLYTTFSFFWYLFPPLILLGVGVVTAPSYCTIYPSLFSYTLLTLVDSPFRKLSTNYANASAPSVPCWDPD